MHDHRPSTIGLVRHLEHAEVAQAVTEQLRKDLAIDPMRLPVPAIGEQAFEDLRTTIVGVLEELQRSGPNGLGAALYRVDIPEAHFVRTMSTGGVHALGGEVVLRALQKVLTRMRYAGRY